MNMDPIKEQCDVDQWLESALSQYGKAEPRTGLESRVLANLRDERGRVASRRRWWWAAGTATATAAAIAMALWVGKSGNERNAAGTMGASTTTQREEARAPVQAGPAPQVAHSAREIKQHMPASRLVRDVVVATTPKLEQFPSRRNLSEAELLLVRRLSDQSDRGALLEATATRAEVDLSIDSLEIRPLQIPDLEVSESETN
jgi:hypothetical protein